VINMGQNHYKTERERVESTFNMGQIAYFA
jgi:hypothetical protein